MQTPRTTVLIPCYRRPDALRFGAALNASFFEREDVEVSVSVDDPVGADEVIAVTREFPRVRWRVIVHETSHVWRPPCRALNAGLRRARGACVLVMSPESALWSDSGVALTEHVFSSGMRDFAIGRVFWGASDGYRDVDDARRTLEWWRNEHGARGGAQPLWYGSIAAPTEAMRAIAGYDERRLCYGGDDDDLRARLVASGVALYKHPTAWVIHFSPSKKMTRADEVAVKCGLYAQAGSVDADCGWPARWGLDYGVVALDW